MILPPPHAIKKTFPLSNHAQVFLEKSRNTLQALGKGYDKRLLIVAGPCSIHDPAAFLEYAKRYKELAQDVEDGCFLILRAFFEKSRTQHGWTGFVNDPDLDGSDNIEKGLFLTRELLIQLAEAEIPISAEFVHPLLAPYFEDLITLGMIGARTSASQVHRHLASSLSMPVGFKNSIDGNIETAFQGILTAQQSHHWVSLNNNGQIAVQKTEGIKDGFLVLRGSPSKSNYDPGSLDDACLLADSFDLPKRFIIDCAHGNSGKCPDKQTDVFRKCLSYIEEGRQEIMGLMLESYLKKGSQSFPCSPHSLAPDVSITDPCLNWDSTAVLIEEAYTLMQPVLAYSH